MRFVKLAMGRAGVLALASCAFGGCRSGEFVPSGPQTRSLREFDRIEIRPLGIGIQEGKDLMDEVRTLTEAFARSFPSDLRPLLYRKHLLNAPEGRLLVLEGTVSKYEAVEESTSNPSDPLIVRASIELDLAFRDETGARVGGGKALVTCQGKSIRPVLKDAERRLAAVVARYIRRAVRDPSIETDTEKDDGP